MPTLILVSFILSPAVYLAGRWRAAALRFVSVVGLAAMWGFFVVSARDLPAATIGMMPFTFDAISLLVTAITLTVGTLSILYSLAEMRGRASEEKYHAMIVLMMGAVIALVSATDLFNLWVWFELTAVSSYLLVAFYRDQPDALAACIRYLIQTASGSILVLFGIALLYAQSGTLDMTVIRYEASPLVVIAGALLAIGFGIKIALAPFATWLPDAYAQAPTGISALLSGIVTISGTFALLRILALLPGLRAEWGALLIGFGVVNMVFGNFYALRQDDVKRVFAGSSICHIGFVLFAFGIGITTGERFGFYAALLHLLVHGLSKALAFFAVGTAIRVEARATASLKVSQLVNLSKRAPLVAFGLMTAVLSLAGTPPLSGFLSKWLILDAGLRGGDAVLIVLTAFAGLNSVVSLGYYLPILSAVFRSDSGHSRKMVGIDLAANPTGERNDGRADLPILMRVPILALSAGVIGLGLSLTLVDQLLVPAAEALLSLFGGY